MSELFQLVTNCNSEILSKYCYGFVMNPMTLFRDINTQRIQDFLQLMRADKPIGTLLLLWPTLWALWFSAGGQLSDNDAWHFQSMNPKVVLVFILGVFFMRSAGCVINDIADRKIDLHVKRTVDRPLTSGRVSTFEALCLFVILCLISFGLVLLLDSDVRKSVLIAAIPSVLIAIAYPFMKRFFVTPQLVLGIAFSCGIPMAFLAHGKSLEFGCWLLVAANITWVVAYDTIYAMVDQDDDEKIGVLSSSRFFGNNVIKAVVFLQALTMILLVAVGLHYHLNTYYFLTLIFSGLFFVYQQYLIKDHVRNLCFQAFLNNDWFGGVVLLAIVLGSQSNIPV